jgi:cobalt transporter subunit CbtB
MNESTTLAIPADAAVNAAAFPRTLLCGAVLHAAVAAALGLLMVWGVGFAGNGVLHETAHDTRHALGFPCH